MNQATEAIFHRGILQPVEPLEGLAEGQRVSIVIGPAEQLEPEEKARRCAELIRRLEAEGSIVHFPPPPGDPIPFKPLIIGGEPMSETVIRMRRGEL